jgi:hypothetical protein
MCWIIDSSTRFVDRDMFMRYWGGGIGHFGALSSEGTQSGSVGDNEAGENEGESSSSVDKTGDLEEDDLEEPGDEASEDVLMDWETYAESD